MNYQVNDWTNFGDVNVEHGQLWIKNAFSDSTEDFAECVRIFSASEFGGPDNVYVIERGSIYIPLDDAEKVKSALDVIGKSLSCATWIDLALAFEAYHGIELDAWGGREVVSVGKPEDAKESVDVDKVLRGNASIRKYLRENYLQ